MKKKEMTSNQLIEAALELFAEHGIEKTSLDMIAQKVGITKPSIYYHFESKEALIDRVFNDTFADYRFDQFIRIDECNEQNFAEKLYQGGLRMLPDNDEFSLRVLNEFIYIAMREEKYLKRVSRIEREFRDGFVSLLKKGADLGIVSPQNIAAKAHMLSVLVDGLTMQLPSELDCEAVWKEAVNSVIIKNKLP